MAAVMASLFDFLVASGVFVFFLLFIRLGWNAYLLWTPVLLFGIVLPGAGIGMVISAGSPGVYYPSVNFFRYDNEQLFGGWKAAEAIHVWAQKDIALPLNCFPKVVGQEVRRGDLREPGRHPSDKCGTPENASSIANTPSKAVTPVSGKMPHA